jgi:L-iditol 2-dehydrogenase
MIAARLHGPQDLRIDRVPCPSAPRAGEALLRVHATGICGSDLHTYQDGRIGDTRVESPLTLGHEFAAIVEATGPDCLDGMHRPLLPGTRVAVDPAIPCDHCEFCQKGHPNLCCNIRFCGLWPYPGSLSEYLLMPAKTCFPLPDLLSDEEGVMLEPLGVAMHALALSKIQIGESAAILGAGPIGLLLLQLARMAGASPIFVSDPLPWRRTLALKSGADQVFDPKKENVVEEIIQATSGRGCDVVWESAWGTTTVAESVEVACLGGHVILVGIPADDKLEVKASSARRKGLTLRFARRMKHTYPRAIQLVSEGKLPLKSLISHRFPLTEAAQAFQMNLNYTPEVLKVIITS